MALMQFHLVTLFPEMFNALDYGITGRARQKEIVKLHFWNPRDYTQDKHGRVDDSPYGGGPGMVMQVQPLRDAIHSAKAAAMLAEKKPQVIYLSPQGKLLDQDVIHRFVTQTDTDFVLVAGRYEGIDERVIEQDIAEEWSIGNYVLSGGELAAMVMIDSIVRLLPGAVGDPASLCNESFTQGLLDYPHYTRPAEIDNQKVPDVLLQGDHKAIERYRLQQSLGKTWLKRPDLLKNRSLTAQETVLLQEFILKLRN